MLISVSTLVPTIKWVEKDGALVTLIDDVIFCFNSILFVFSFFKSTVHSLFYFNFTCFNCLLQMAQNPHFILERSSSVLGILITWNGYSCELEQINQLQMSLILTERSNTNSQFLVSFIPKSVLGFSNSLNFIGDAKHKRQHHRGRLVE